MICIYKVEFLMSVSFIRFKPYIKPNLIQTCTIYVLKQILCTFGKFGIGDEMINCIYQITISLACDFHKT